MSRFVVRICPNYLYNFRQNSVRRWIEKKRGSPTYFYQADSYQHLMLFRTREKEDPQGFRMSMIYDSSVTQYDFFMEEVQPLIEKYIVRGIDANVLLFGSSLSGKRYTLDGPSEHPGLVYSALDAFFSLIQQEEEASARPSPTAASTQKSEVYLTIAFVDQEMLKDGLAGLVGSGAVDGTAAPELSLKEDPKKGIYISGLQRVRLTSASEGLEILSRLQFGQVNIHTVVSLTLERPPPTTSLSFRSGSGPSRSRRIVGTLSFLLLEVPKDPLRGSVAPQTFWYRCLESVFSELRNSEPSVRFHRSRVTSLLRDSITAQKPTLVCSCLSPFFESYPEVCWSNKVAETLFGFMERFMEEKRKMMSVAERQIRTSPTKAQQLARAKKKKVPPPSSSVASSSVAAAAAAPAAVIPSGSRVVEDVDDRQVRSKKPRAREDQGQEQQQAVLDRILSQEQSQPPSSQPTSTSAAAAAAAPSHPSSSSQRRRARKPPTSKKKKKRSGRGNARRPASAAGPIRSPKRPPRRTGGGGGGGRRRSGGGGGGNRRRQSLEASFRRDEQMYTTIMEDRIRAMKDESRQLEETNEDLLKKNRLLVRKKKKTEREMFVLRREYQERVTELTTRLADAKADVDRLNGTNRRLNKSIERTRRSVEDRDQKLMDLSQQVGNSVLLQTDQIVVSKKQFHEYEEYVQHAMEINERLHQASVEKDTEIETLKAALEDRDAAIEELRGKVTSLAQRADQKLELRASERILRVKVSILKRALADSLRRIAETDMEKDMAREEERRSALDEFGIGVEDEEDEELLGDGSGGGGGGEAPSRDEVMRLLDDDDLEGERSALVEQ